MPNPFVQVAAAWLAHPVELARAWQELATVSWATGMPSPLAEAAEGDDRFADEAWRVHPFFHGLMQQYLGLTRTLERQIYDTPGADERAARNAAFWLRHWCNAFAPSNFLPTNPVALRRAFESGGASLRAGYQEWLRDLLAGDLRMVDRTRFELGRDLAATPGRVVLRNAMMELIQYTPLNAQVHAVPLVLVPPWINKYYILDLTQQQSMVRHLVAQGFDVFVVSWKNPGSAMAGLSFEDHLFDGILAALEAARAIAGVPQVHAVGYCIGGTALATLMAWLNRRYPPGRELPVAHWTLLATLTDFARPGDIASFISEESVAWLEELMARQGFLDAQQIGWSFRMLRPNTQVWRYVVHKYLLGEATPAMAPLAWNADGTRQPRATHAFCLRELYLANKLARPDALELRGQPIDLGRIRQELYAVGALADHITPWRSTYCSAALVGAPVRYVLTASGHILGIINPPGSSAKQQYWAGPLLRDASAKEWLATREPVAGSWWEDWCTWLAQRCGALRVPAAQAHPDYPWLGDAPGIYVRES
ncbi:alpha/beta fold hydrolase [Pseudoduganella sp. DS3]|uniref:Alpha/beta fold hydrolase n=1 Tax=Pseudoduganella guangdongensis TaxID=2692179 RepID=A0A6N9HLV1_9BURK|nr:alpha/beta fold hydrolase [Pseudoduganella guangdongensis]MYN03942.1 alpha/beta fold hydrolase [Pseudoduganella guangdongensis]